MAWILEKRVSQGGMGEVYLALTPSRQRVIVKTVAAGESRERLLHEIQLLAKVRHPHIVAFQGCLADSREIFGVDRGLSYWMDYIEGDEILSASRGQGVGDVLEWFEQALEALRYLHAQGFLHGDISPKNIIIDHNGRNGVLKLLDFGLASALEQSTALAAATLPYLAPERLGGHRLPASDLFSLGTVFYEALAGRHPRSSARGLHEMAAIAAEPLSLGEAHAAAARVVEGLIEADLMKRTQSAEEALRLLKGGAPKGGAPDRADRGAVPFHSLRFWGASIFLERFARFLRDRRSGIFAVHGTTGVGKKRFLREISLQCALAGIPVFERHDGNFGPLKGDEKGVFLFRSLESASLTELTRLLSFRRKPALLASRLIVLEWNDDFVEEETAPFFSGLIHWPETEDVFLKDLDREQVHGLVKAALGSDFTKTVADRLWRQTGGNPGLLVEILGPLRSGRKPEVETFGSRRDLFVWKIASLPEEERSTLAAVVCASGPVSQASLARILPESEPSLRRLVSRNLLHSASGLYRPSHPLLAEALGEVLEPAALSRLHRLWLEGLAEVPHPHLQKLHHAVALKEEAAVIAGARPVLDLLWSQERKKEALPLVDRCLDVVRDRVETSRLLKEKINLLSDLGRYAEALEVCETWFALGPDNDDMALKTLKYWFLTGTNHQNLGHEAEAADRLRRCLALGDPQDGEHRPFLARAHSLLGLLDLRRGDAVAAKDHLRTALSLAGPAGRRRAEIHRHLSEVHAASSEDAEALRALHEARRLYEEDGFEQGVLACLLQEGNLNLARDLDAAESAYLRAEEIAQGLDNEALLARVWHNRGVLERKRGRLAESLKFLSLAREVFEMLNHPGELAECLRNLALTAASGKESGMSLPFDWKPVIDRMIGLNRELLREPDMDLLLKRLMDSAMDLARAERGFLILRAPDSDDSDDPEADAPIPGFNVVVARHISRESLKSPQHALSLSVVQRAMETGDPVATDNALEDPRFRDAPSVHLGRFKSILALPVHGSEGVILGVFYLDHSLQDGLFQGDLLKALRLFAGMASIALQKGRMIEELEVKNADLNHTVDEQASQLARLEREVKASRLQLKNEYSEIVGRSPKMTEVLSLVDKVTDAKVPVWIFGESGTGKEAIARALHFNSARKTHPFVVENCSALPESLLESELFGHKKGAFTHATADKKGLLHYADKGTIFLDEIADMSPALQSKLLRFLQEGDVRPLGSHQVFKIDVRVVSASNKDLRRLVAEGKFREDLFYRLNGITIKLPSLRERLADLPLLAGHFLKGKTSLHPEALRLLMSYAWPGNVRELQQTLETAALFAENGRITRKSLQFKEALFEKSLRAGPETPSPGPPGSGKPLASDLESLLRTLRDHCYHKGNAAKALGISRRYLYTRLKQHGISPKAADLKAFIDGHLRG